MGGDPLVKRPVGEIDYMDWAVRTRETADRLGCDLHDAFGVVKMSPAAWRGLVLSCATVPGPWAHEAAALWYEQARSRVCQLAGSLSAVEIRTSKRKVAV